MIGAWLNIDNFTTIFSWKISWKLFKNFQFSLDKKPTACTMLSLFSFAAFLISLDFENATCRFSGSASCSQNRMFKNHTSWDPSAHLLVNIFETFLPELREISIFPLHMVNCFLIYRFTDRKLNLAASSETVWSFVSEKKKALSQKDGLSTPLQEYLYAVCSPADFQWFSLGFVLQW